jgi:hypothetical protein
LEGADILSQPMAVAANLTFEQAAAVPGSALTAVQAMRDSTPGSLPSAASLGGCCRTPPETLDRPRVSRQPLTGFEIITSNHHLW